MWQLAKTTSKGFIWLFFILMGVLITLNSVRYLFPHEHSTLFLASKRPYFHIYLPALYGHAFSAGTLLIVGFLGFSKRIRTRHIRWHRRLGNVYIYGILFLSAPCGLIMAFFADGARHVAICFILLSLLWWITTWLGWQSIRQKRLEQHRWWMIRSYALAVSAINLRLYLFIGAYFFGFRGAEAYAWIAWLSWVPNLVVVEGWKWWNIPSRAV